MKAIHHIALRINNDQQRADFLEAGVKLPSGVKLPRVGVITSFDIAEDDPRWEKVLSLAKKYRVIDIVRRKPFATESQIPDLKWLEGYSGQTADQLLSLEREYRIDSFVLAFEQAIGQRAARERKQSLTDVERIVLAVEALEREVNNGGYDQFFVNPSREFAATIVESLLRIGCPRSAKITQRAINALRCSDLTVGAIETAMATDSKRRDEKLSRCDELYCKSREPVAERLFAFIKTNKALISL